MESSVDRDENGPIAPDPLASSVKCSVVQILNPGDLPGASADIGLDKNAPKKSNTQHVHLQQTHVHYIRKVQ